MAKLARMANLTGQLIAILKADGISVWPFQKAIPCIMARVVICHL